MRISLLLAGTALFLYSCSHLTDSAGNSNLKTIDLAAVAGKWKLTQEENKTAQSEKVEFTDQPSTIILHLQKNGYFIIYDSFTDPNWEKKELPLIQQRSKGQWKLNRNQLTLNHLREDTTYAEALEITHVSNTELITRGKNNRSNVYKTYGK